MRMVSGLAELAREFELRDTEKPYVELIDGIEVSKSPTVTRHSLLQTVLGSWLLQWAEPYGIVGTEYRVYPVPKGERLSSLVPDVAFITFERMRSSPILRASDHRSGPISRSRFVRPMTAIATSLARSTFIVAVAYVR